MLCFYRYPKFLRYFTLARLGFSPPFKHTNMKPSVTCLLWPKSKYDDNTVVFLIEWVTFTKLYTFLTSPIPWLLMQVISDHSLFHPEPNVFLVIFMFFNGSFHLLNLNFSGAHAESDVWSTPKLGCDLVLCIFDILKLKKWFPDFLYVIRQTFEK